MLYNIKCIFVLFITWLFQEFALFLELLPIQYSALNLKIFTFSGFQIALL